MTDSADTPIDLRSQATAQGLLQAIRAESVHLPPMRLMEVCGTHTMAIRRAGIPALLPDNLTLLSGPGCPVCVTPNRVIDTAVALARQPGLIVTTFGDMLRVPGSSSSLAQERTHGGDVRVVYSPRDALKLAREQTDREVIFIAVGFETTAPLIAATLLEAQTLGVGNFSLLVAHKLVPPALDALLGLPNFSVSGFVLPGHVSVILGSDAYRALVACHRVASVVTGFEPGDVLLAILMLVRQIKSCRAEVEVEYRSVVHPQGNRHAQELMARVFEPVDSAWRGVGLIPGSGLKLREAFARFDAESRHSVVVEPEREHPGCRCGEVLIGAIRPTECALFGQVCSPGNPIGPCMVSSEGTCAAYHRYERRA